ncbi:MAG: hypothetical protein R3250_16480, partial [Melioribacteraceae bacterium]|nr:hypothetical protein [Melioribacteraceae bacterium]
NTLYIAHRNYPPATLVRNDTYDWVLSDIIFTGQPTEWVAGNYPGVVGFHEQRLFLSATKDQSQTFWASKIGEPYTDFTIGTNDDAAFKYTIATDKDNRITWFSSGDFLMMGTTGGEFKIGSTDFKQTITPTNVRATRQTNYGAAFVRPIRIGTEVIFVQKGGLKVRNLEYSLERDKYAAEDLTFLSEHITKGGIIDVDYQNEPDSIGWFLLAKGDLVGMAYEPELNTIGWFRYNMENTIIRSVAVIDGYFDVSYDEVWVAVDRIINSQQVRYIEILEPSLKLLENIEDSFYVDSGLSLPLNQLPTNVVTGLDHLEGETVDLLVDGLVHPSQTVVSGSVTLNTQATKAVHAGLGFTSTLRTLRIEGGNPIGTSQGKIKRIKKVQIRLNRSLGLKVGDENLDWDFFGPPVMNQSNELFTGDREIELDDGYSKDAEFNIVQDQPLPTTIVAVMPEARTE